MLIILEVLRLQTEWLLTNLNKKYYKLNVFSLPLSVILFGPIHFSELAQSLQGVAFYSRFSPVRLKSPPPSLLSAIQIACKCPEKGASFWKDSECAHEGGEQRHSSFLSLFFPVCRLMLARSLSADMSPDLSEVWRRQRAARGRIIIFIKLVQRLHWEFLTFSFIRLVWPWALFAKRRFIGPFGRLLLFLCFWVSVVMEVVQKRSWKNEKTRRM